MEAIDPQKLFAWCVVPYQDLESHPDLKIPLRLCDDSNAMGALMADELVTAIAAQPECRLIIPCGPACWYEPFGRLVNQRGVSLRRVVVFHMDECLDWQGQELPRQHPYSFRGFMEKHFYGPLAPELNVPQENRVWLNAKNVPEVQERIHAAPIDLVYGGWGQDGHVAYNQSRRHPYHPLTLDALRASTVRVQENNWDTILALAQRTFGAAYQFVPPMSVTLGMQEILSARKIRLFSDTGAWKQTALRVALFSPPTVEYPMTLLQEHPDALLTATIATAMHPISEHPEWDLGLQHIR
jgi:glucosamine-6-phosphate deaminase